MRTSAPNDAFSITQENLTNVESPEVKFGLENNSTKKGNSYGANKDAQAANQAAGDEQALGNHAARDEPNEQATEATKMSTDGPDFDDVLEHVGSWGRFQILLTVVFLPFNLFLGYVSFSSILTNFSPPHWCQVPELENMTVQERKDLAIPKTNENGWEEYSKCSVYSPNWTEVLAAGQMIPHTNWTVTSCHNGWEFDIENYHRTIVTDFSWVCDEAWIPTLSQTIFFAGSVFGNIIFGWISDNFGRVPATIIASLFALSAGIALPFTSSYQIFFIIRFIMGFSYLMFWSQPYILVLEYVENSKRTFVGNIGLATFLTLSGLYQPWLVKGVGDWRTYNWIIFGQMGFIVIFPLIVPESGRWLLSRGNTERTIRILKRIAKINKKEVDEKIFEELRKSVKTVKSAQNSSYLALFRTAHMRRITLLATLLYVITFLVFDACVRNIVNMHLSIYISFMITIALELPADLLAIVGINYLGRRWSASLSLFLFGLFMFCAIPLKDNLIGESVLTLMARFCGTYAMNTLFQFTVEVMPTELRSQGYAVASVMGNLALMLSPYIVSSAELHPVAPLVILGVCGWLGAIPGLLLPETADANLPEKVEDMKYFGKNDSFFWMPFMGKEKRNRKKQTN